MKDKIEPIQLKFKEILREKSRSIYLKMMGSIAKPIKGVHILNSHFVTSIAEGGHDDFDFFIRWLKDHGNIISLNDAIDRIDKKVFDETSFALTFDDGFQEMYKVAFPVLEKFKINAAFFLNMGPILNSNDSLYMENFEKRVDCRRRKFLTCSQVKELHEAGNLIGSHTLDHVKMRVDNEFKFTEQVINNKNIIEDLIGSKVDYFAWPYGRLSDIDEQNLEMLMKHHKYIFSGDDYRNYKSFGERVYNRRHIEPCWDKSHISYFISKTKKSI